LIRWNAAVMVIKANHKEKGIGGHLSTFASSATLYEVGFNHFFRGKTTTIPATTSTSRATPPPACTPGPSSKAGSKRSSWNFRFEIGGRTGSLPIPTRV
jgi:hypothetical protein